MSRIQRRRARRYNPNRQPTIEDYVSRHPSPPLEEHSGAPCRRVRPVTPPVREERSREGVASREQPAVRVNGVMFGGLRVIPTDPAVDPPPYHCYNCWQHGHDMPRCHRPRVRAFCNNCGRHGVDVRDCPRCSAAHQRFVRANFANEQEMTEEIERRNREALRLEEERSSTIYREQASGAGVAGPYAEPCAVPGRVGEPAACAPGPSASSSRRRVEPVMRLRRQQAS